MKKRALIVDDNENNLLLEKDLLVNYGFEVFEADTAEMGIAIALKEKLDIIVMDVRLPDMRGPEAAKLLRQLNETKHIPIIFVTASVMKDERKELSMIENSGYISKPINTRTFAKEIYTFIK
jgi:CheY-like chemotaxis protein